MKMEGFWVFFESVEVFVFFVRFYDYVGTFEDKII